MDTLNYHHLLYFWVVAREGSISRACAELHLTQPTISAQLKRLERSLGEALFARVGRGLALTEAGRLVYGYAEEIFSLGRELRGAVKGRPRPQALRLAVGIVETLPKLVVYRILEPALRLPAGVTVVCKEGNAERLLADLAAHELDVVLADAPVPSGARRRVFNHPLGDSALAFFAPDQDAARYRKDFPNSLHGAPFLLPAAATSARRLLDQWFAAHGIAPAVKGEFADSALLKVFGQAGFGLFAAPAVVQTEIERQYHVKCVGQAEAARARFYAISVERRLRHPAVTALADAARGRLFQ